MKVDDDGLALALRAICATLNGDYHFELDASASPGFVNNLLGRHGPKNTRRRQCRGSVPLSLAKMKNRQQLGASVPKIGSI